MSTSTADSRTQTDWLCVFRSHSPHVHRHDAHRNDAQTHARFQNRDLQPTSATYPPTTFSSALSVNMADLRQPNLPLLSLPAELRNAIYEYVVDTPTGLVFSIEHRGFVITSSNRMVASQANPLQRVCRLMRAET
jgi:hypothetical protein